MVKASWMALLTISLLWSAAGFADDVQSPKTDGELLPGRPEERLRFADRLHERVAGGEQRPGGRELGAQLRRGRQRRTDAQRHQTQRAPEAGQA